MTKKQYRMWLEDQIYGDVANRLAAEIQKEVDAEILQKLRTALTKTYWPSR